VRYGRFPNCAGHLRSPRATVAAVAATTAIEILLRHLLVSDIRSADSPLAALAELRQDAATEAKALCDLARRTRHANPRAATEALAVAEDLARIVSEISKDVASDAGEPIGPGRVMSMHQRGAG
jgi:hypothetical protein